MAQVFSLPFCGGGILPRKSRLEASPTVRSLNSFLRANDLLQANIHEILRYVNPRTQDNSVFEEVIGVKQIFRIPLRMTVCMLRITELAIKLISKSIVFYSLLETFLLREI